MVVREVTRKRHGRERGGLRVRVRVIDRVGVRFIDTNMVRV